MIQKILTGWKLMRWLRLALGLVIAVQAVQHRDPLAALVSALLLFQTVTNRSCCGGGSCALPDKPDVKA